MRRGLFSLAIAALAFWPWPALADLSEDLVGFFGTISTWKWTEVPHSGKQSLGKWGLIMRPGMKDPSTGNVELTALAVLCAKGQGGLMIQWMNRDVVGKKGLEVRYRFEGQPERKVNAIYQSPNQVVSYNSADIRQFLTDAALADSVFVQVSSAKFGVIGTTLEAKGGKDLVDKYAVDCPRVVGKKKR